MYCCEQDTCLVNVGYDVRGTINLYVKSCQPVSQCSYVTIGSCDRDRCCSQTPDRCFCHPGTHDAHVHLSVSQLILGCVFGEIFRTVQPVYWRIPLNADCCIWSWKSSFSWQNINTFSEKIRCYTQHHQLQFAVVALFKWLAFNCTFFVCSTLLATFALKNAIAFRQTFCKLFFRIWRELWDCDVISVTSSCIKTQPTAECCCALFGIRPNIEKNHIRYISRQWYTVVRVSESRV